MYRPGRVLYSGGTPTQDSSSPASARAAVIDLTAQTPAWQQTSPTLNPRVYHTLTTLADGSVLAVGGEPTWGQTGSSEVSGGILQSEIWNPNTKAWSPAAPAAATRGYHSSAILMPDGTVLVAGSGQANPGYAGQNSAQIYSPPYLFNGARPTIASAPSSASYGATIRMATSDAASINAVNLVSLGAGGATRSASVGTGGKTVWLMATVVLKSAGTAGAAIASPSASSTPTTAATSFSASAPTTAATSLSGSAPTVAATSVSATAPATGSPTMASASLSAHIGHRDLLRGRHLTWMRPMTRCTRHSRARHSRARHSRACTSLRRAARVTRAARAEFIYSALLRHLPSSLFCYHGRALRSGGGWTAWFRPTSPNRTGSRGSSAHHRV